MVAGKPKNNDPQTSNTKNNNPERQRGAGGGRLRLPSHQMTPIHSPSNLSDRPRFGPQPSQTYAQAAKSITVVEGHRNELFR
ncbi:hypothetical protein TNCV_1231531 [Trichonephila clavipes]|nr:hypothetical protein TNCV_1231531 [Trichonephila clavipes]